MHFKKTSQESDQAKGVPEHVNSKECLNMCNPHEFVFNQYNGKVYKKNCCSQLAAAMQPGLKNSLLSLIKL